jgi:hypothetical protein
LLDFLPPRVAATRPFIELASRALIRVAIRGECEGV